MNENLFLILEGLLVKNKIKVDNDELRLQLFGHPTYPSLNSLTGVLDHFKVPNLALEIPKSEENIEFLPNHFIAHIKNENGDNFALISKHNNGLRMSENGKKYEFLTYSQFIIIWTGIILGIDIDEYKKTTQDYNFKKLLVTVSPLVIVLTFIITNQNIFESIHFFLSTIGIYVCSLIFQHELGENSPLLDKICSGKNKKLSCADVMNSKGGKFLGILKLSDLGMIYFVFITILSFSITLKSHDFKLLFQISILALPFTIYSIIYQAVVVKKWCLLCLSTISILFLQASISYFGITSAELLQLSINLIPALLVSLFISASFWFYISQKLKENKQIFDLKIQHSKFKRNFEIFKALLLRSPELNTQIPTVNEITFGNSNTNLEILIITNPLCSFCKNSHKIIHQTLEKSPDIKIIVRFNLSNKKENTDTQIASKLIDLYKTKGQSACIEAMNDAYNNFTPLKWIQTYGKCNNINIYNVLEKEKEWCTQNHILFTPEVLINGRSYPKEYDFEDLQHFIESLLDEEITEQSKTVLIP
ncbi:thioredoxin domain-containing protein [Marinifilum sp. N1E240]|uniref:vitamin K epoxide reductase family protein n=1 Tax=Marinifilum sp. N1E240 TaxID=2608082 RepID=UPI00128AF8BF|nr:vitamin K epoxide reductase family protein [Marinifilum sp. N1E240]MPQ49070.1 thioredoxin domain-containing protein [Marinifilum sp. N1E240]